jgi:LysR family transcriptional regulator, glycine cleavage system transcriptional activator
MRKLPPLTELRAFEAAARHLSFKMAAAELSVTPTAISHQVKLLERHCGQPLFRRRPRPLVLTWAGQQLFPVVRDGFETFAEALTTVRAGASTGRLRITATNAFAARWLVPRLPNWRDAYPRLKLTSSAQMRCSI